MGPKQQIAIMRELFDLNYFYLLFDLLWYQKKIL